VSWGTSKPVLDKRIAERRGAPLQPRWTIHDIRRSVVTHISELGYAQPHVVEAIVNHISGSKAGVAGVYNRATYLPEKRPALEDWGRYLTGLVGAPLSMHQSNGVTARSMERVNFVIELNQVPRPTLNRLRRQRPHACQ